MWKKFAINAKCAITFGTDFSCFGSPLPYPTKFFVWVSFTFRIEDCTEWYQEPRSKLLVRSVYGIRDFRYLLGFLGIYFYF